MQIIGVSNRLRIYEGNILLIPGCEPISVTTHISNFQINRDVVTLFNRFEEICPSSYITLNKAMEAIPEATLWYGHDPAFRWFVLPSGPPPSNLCKCPRGVPEDWYQILRENADTTDLTDDQKAEILADCSAFSYDWKCS